MGTGVWPRILGTASYQPASIVSAVAGYRGRARQREETQISNADGLIFVDTDASTTYMFSLYYHGCACPRLAEFAAEAGRRYDLYFLCEDDIPYDQTWDRSGQAQRSTFQKQIRADLLRRKIRFVSLRGSIDERMAAVTTVVDGFDRFESLRSP
ncbi:MAG: ATP-binding protein [Gammaproteobacteria bacterium]|nr:ATP-binding protein [Gammaproteobacteria bacterium]